MQSRLSAVRDLPALLAVSTMTFLVLYLMSAVVDGLDSVPLASPYTAQCNVVWVGVGGARLVGMSRAVCCVLRWVCRLRPASTAGVLPW